MKSADYRIIVSRITRNAVKKHLPAAKAVQIKAIGSEVAKAVHARMYGASVDKVASPIWRDHDCFKKDIGDMQPTKTAQELLDEE